MSGWNAPDVRPRVLVLRSLGLGDFLTGLPAYRALRRALPGHEIVLAAPAALAGLVPLTGSIDRLLPTEPLAAVRWAGPAPELAVNLHGRGPQSHRLLLSTEPGRVIAFHHPAVSDVDGPAWRADEHEVRRWCRLLGWAGLPADPADLLLAAPAPGASPGDHAGAVLVHPGAAAVARRWPAARFAAVARALAADSWPVRITGSAAEARLAGAVAGAAGLPAAAVLAGRTDLATLAATVAGAALLVCGDTGVAHLATALGTPSVLLFGPTPPEHWGPLRDQDRHAVLWAGETGDPHGRRRHPGLTSIGVPAVLDAARRLLRTVPAPPGRATARMAPPPG